MISALRDPNLSVTVYFNNCAPRGSYLTLSSDRVPHVTKKANEIADCSLNCVKSICGAKPRLVEYISSQTTKSLSISKASLRRRQILEEAANTKKQYLRTPHCDDCGRAFS